MKLFKRSEYSERLNIPEGRTYSPPEKLQAFRVVVLPPCGGSRALLRRARIIRSADYPFSRTRYYFIIAERCFRNA